MCYLALKANVWFVSPTVSWPRLRTEPSGSALSLKKQRDSQWHASGHLGVALRHLRHVLGSGTFSEARRWFPSLAHVILR
jgi:hypothetical protein